MTNSTIQSIDLTPMQSEIIDIIIRDQLAKNMAAEPEHVILYWAQGATELETAQTLRISEAEVCLIRRRWLEALPRIQMLEKKTHTSFNSLVSLIFRTPNEEKSPSKSELDIPPSDAGRFDPKRPKEMKLAARALIEILHHKPKDYGINRSNWTYASLAEAFGSVYNIRPSSGTVGRLLRDAGIRWKKAKRVLTSPDPRYREKVDLLLSTLHSLGSDEDLFFIDELGPLQVKRYGGKCYTYKGHTPTYPQNQASKGSITLYGALSATRNQMTWFYGDTKNTAGMIELAEILYNQNKEKSRIYMTWDAASWHRSGELIEWANEINRYKIASIEKTKIEFVPLPSSAQFLNVIEAVFSGMKRAVIHGSNYESEEEMKIAISTHFRDRNEFFIKNPKRAGNKIWDIDFFRGRESIRSGDYKP